MNRINASEVSSDSDEEESDRDIGENESTSHPIAARKNVSDGERAVTGVAGAALAICGMRHGGVLGWLGVVAGTALLTRSVTGHCPVYAAFGVDHRSGNADRTASGESTDGGDERTGEAAVDEVDVDVDVAGERAEDEPGADTEVWESDPQRDV